jgi:branched-chain amino acid aminotransferase
MYYSEGKLFKKTASLPEEIWESGKCFYEVFRVINRIPVFLDDHLARLNESVRLSGYSIESGTNEIKAVIGELIRLNHLEVGNIRLVYRIREPDPPVLFSCCIPYSYPDTRQYRLGIPITIYRRVRHHPNIKQYDSLYHQQISEFMTRGNYFEVLLADLQDHITEGSKSNVFLIRHDRLYTAPGKDVLKGITREKVINLCNELNYSVIEKSISIDSLSTMEAVFLTGTSPKILPVNRIDNRSFGVDHPMMRKLMEAYDGLIRRDLEDYRTV